MRATPRVGAALLLLATVASYGVGLATPAAAAPTAVVPSGGCWRYVPSDPALDSAPLSDVSSSLEPWTTDPAGGLLLETGGSNLVDGTRTATATIVSGPVLSASTDVSGTASFLLSVDGTPLAAPAQVLYTATAGHPVEDVAATVQLPASAAGAHEVRLDGVFLDVSPTLRLACNGQTDQVGTPGSNPATDPLSTDLTTAYTLATGASVTVTGVADQEVHNAGRPSDVATVQLAGLASAATASLQLCTSSGTCTGVGSVETGVDGTATTTFVVPAAAMVGAGTLKVGDGTTTVTTAFTVLGTQQVTAAETLGTDFTTVTLTGTGWDPTRQVTIRGYAGADSSSAATADPKVVATVDAAGRFTAKFKVSATDTKSVIVDQARSSTHIGAVYLISGVIGGAAGSDDGSGDGGTSTGSGGGSGTGTTGGGSTTPTTPPEDIPLPPNVPVTEPTGPSAPVVADLQVSEAHLDGEATLSELFGGSPQRDLVFLVQNLGDQTVTDPIVRVSVGRSPDLEPEVVDVQVGTLAPQAQTVVTVPLTLPMAAFGTYHVVGQVGETESGAFALEWTTYPWGLFALNAVALLLLGAGIRYRLGLRRRARALGVPDADSVVDLTAADAWWAYRSGLGPKPLGPGGPAGRPPVGPDEVTAGEAVVDLEAAEAWWRRRGSNAS